MATIRQLTPSMINKIAAGEVIERPASVVKELIENALDAGAGRIDVAFERAGRDLISIVDDGCGIEADQLLLALSSHATSKIAEVDDLFSIRSFGFRGEALASIAEISQMTLKSRPVGSNDGALLRAEGEKREPIIPCGMATGTAIEVRNLFFNTPVRRKYMKSDITEISHISEAFLRLALPNTQVHFSLKNGRKRLYDLPATDSFLDRIRRCCGDEVADALIPVDFNGTEAGEVHIHGYVSHPDLSRGNAGMQYLFLNRRFIKDKTLQHALQQGYRGLLTTGRYPVVFLMIDLDPEQVDINVHPTKQEVRFLDPQKIYGGFLAAIREKFLQSDLRSHPERFGAADEPQSEENGNSDFQLQGADASATGSLPFDRTDPRATIDEKTTASRKDEWFRSIAKPSNDSPLTSVPAPFSSKPAPFKPFPETGSRPFSVGRTSSVPSDKEPFAPTSPAPTEPVPAEETTPDRQKIVQIHQKYLVFETDEGMALVDQHALHERILYEKLKRQLAQGKLDTQLLLVPEMVDLPPVQAALALESRPVLEEFGIQIEPFGGNTILVSGYPAILSRLTPSEIFLTALEVIRQKGKQADRSDLLDEMMHQSSCKAAIKGGDSISESTRLELLRMAQEEIHTDHCPHGRPTTLLYSLQEIDKLFKRT